MGILQNSFETRGFLQPIFMQICRKSKDGLESVEEDERTGHPVAATSEKEIDIIKELIEIDARYTLEENSSDIGH